MTEIFLTTIGILNCMQKTIFITLLILENEADSLEVITLGIVTTCNDSKFVASIDD